MSPLVVTQVPLKQTFKLLEKYFSQDISNLFRPVLATTYFMFKGEFFTNKRTEPRWGPPLSPTIANFYMEHFEEIEMALETAPVKPSCFYRYVADMFVIWPHGAETLPEFQNHLNGVHPNMKFTMQVEKEGTQLFLNI